MFLLAALFRLAQIFTSPVRMRKAALSAEAVLAPLILNSVKALHQVNRRLVCSMCNVYLASEAFICSFVPWLSLLMFIKISEWTGCLLLDGIFFLSFWPRWFYSVLFQGGRPIGEIFRNPTREKPHGTLYLETKRTRLRRLWRRISCAIGLSKHKWGCRPGDCHLFEYYLHRKDPHGNLEEQIRRSHVSRSRELYQTCQNLFNTRRAAFLSRTSAAREWLEHVSQWDAWLPSIGHLAFWVYASILFAASIFHYIFRLAQYKLGYLQMPP